jgi:hypothetical protein
MKKNRENRDVLTQVRQAAKSHDPYPGGYKGWVNILSPIALQVTKERLADGLAILEALLEGLPGRGMCLEPSKESQRMGDGRVQLCVAHKGFQFDLKIAEGYRQAPGYEPHVGSGVLRLQLGGYQRWEDRKRAGKVVERIPKILDWIEQQTAHWEVLHAEREARELEEEAAQTRALDLAREQWVLDAIAATAANQAESWQRAATLRAYREALIGKFNEPGTLAWAAWIGRHADAIDPLVGRPPVVPIVKAPPDWELQHRNR